MLAPQKKQENPRPSCSFSVIRFKRWILRCGFYEIERFSSDWWSFVRNDALWTTKSQEWRWFVQYSSKVNFIGLYIFPRIEMSTSWILIRKKFIMSMKTLTYDPFLEWDKLELNFRNFFCIPFEILFIRRMAYSFLFALFFFTWTLGNKKIRTRSY